ncbi:luciferase family protein [Streptomyces sp. NPDC047000]|uniref:luciferase family protein n=1 Tax=Streptomyces sp. NPDC047000 TaxID=3155474 RepID=UPI0033E72B99
MTWDNNTRPRQFREHLEATTAVRTMPGSAWVTVRLDVAADVDLLMTLASLALQAHQAWPNPDDDPRTHATITAAGQSRPRLSDGTERYSSRQVTLWPARQARTRPSAHSRNA